MASATNVVFMDYRIRDVVFLISLTHKVFHPTGVGRALALQGLWRFCPYLLRQYIFNQNLCIGFSEFNKPAMCYISHSHFFSILLFVLPLRTELSTHFILIKVYCYNG